MIRALLACPALAALLFVQALAQDRIGPMPPQLLIRPDPNQKLQPLVLEKARINVVITGYMAQTTMTLTFKNDNSRVMEGELVFPLPEGAAVSGYGLDVGGEMVDGVPVEKTKARVTFETEVRKGVDPGLVEHVKGNSFRTRIYPIPANGTRTVKVQYQSDLIAAGAGVAYTLPLNWDQQIAEGSIRIEVVQGPGEPKIEKAPVDRFVFEKQADRYVAERKFAKVGFVDNIVVVLPEVKREHVVVEKWQAEDGSSSAHFFAINDTLPIPARDLLRKMPAKVAILWDGSLSRAEADKQRELGLIGKLAGGFSGTTVDLIVFRNTIEAPVSFKIEKGNASKLVEAVKAVVYDGATDLGAIKIGKDYDWALLFTDGLGNIGQDMPANAECPVYCVSNDARANHALLRYLSQATGGQYFNLATLTDEQAVSAAGVSAFCLVSAEYKADEIAEVYPKPGTAVLERVAVAGRLLKDNAIIKLNYGFGKRITHTTTLTLKQDGATQTNLVARNWAGMKVADLSVLAEKNEKELLALGQQFGIVTPNTSLMVLETLEQYLTYHIAPPRSRELMYKQYTEAVEKEQVAAKKVEQDKITRVVALWQNRVKWWETKFEYPRDFKYVELEKGKNGGAAYSGEALRHRADEPRPAADPHAPASPVVVAAGRAAGPAGANGDSGGRHPDGKDDKGGSSGPSIQIKAWDPNTPYLSAMKAAGADKAYATYLAQRKENAASPAFYLDCGDWLLKNNQPDLGLRVLSNIVELQLDDASLVRIAAHKLAQVGQFDAAIDLFEKVLKLRPEEPQSFRDLALVLADRADANPASATAVADYQRALDLLHKVVMNHWDRFEEIELIALMEANRLLAKTAAMSSALKNPFDSRLVKNLDCDVRIVMTWDADMTDIDLWVTEPSGEKCFYSHNRTTIGGAMSKDFTQGYGPEEYILRKMMAGTYKVQCNFYGSSQQKVAGACTVQATVITNFGRPDEKRQHLTLRLTQKKDVVDIGEVKLGQ